MKEKITSLTPLLNFRLFQKLFFTTTLLFMFCFFGLVKVNFAESPTPASETPTLTPTTTPIPTSVSTPTPTPGVSDEEIKKLQDQIKEYEQKITDLQGQSKTLSSQIAIMDSQIKLTELRINETRQIIGSLLKDIDLLKSKITHLENDINLTTRALLKRIIATYQVGRIETWQVFLASDNVSSFLTRLSYLKVVQMSDKKNVYAAEQAKTDYANQKNILEEKQKEEESLKAKLEGYTQQLDNEKKAKQSLLEVTKNDEKKYQELLAKARAEYEAIQGIFAGKGSEILAGDIKEGEKIASVIVGASACSTGTHLHFEVVENNAHQNPANYLSSKDIEWDLCGWFGCDGPFGFSGSWQWPINNKPRITQGYGMTAYASRTGAYGGGPHTGIDMVSDDMTVKAVKDGALYRGSIACGGKRLYYVRMRHKENGIDTLYLHVNYF